MDFPDSLVFSHNKKIKANIMKKKIFTASLLMTMALPTLAQVKLGISEQVRLRELKSELREPNVFQYKKNTSRKAKEMLGINP